MCQGSYPEVIHNEEKLPARTPSDRMSVIRAGTVRRSGGEVGRLRQFLHREAVSGGFELLCGSNRHPEVGLDACDVFCL